MNDELDSNFSDDLSDPLVFETLAASLQINQREAKTLVESMARMLQGAMPDRVTISRGGWFLSKEKPIEELLVRFDDTHYQISKSKGSSSSYEARALKIVRGIALKSNEIELEECIKKIVQELSQMSKKNGNLQDELRKFISG